MNISHEIRSYRSIRSLVANRLLSEGSINDLMRRWVVARMVDLDISLDIDHLSMSSCVDMEPCFFPDATPLIEYTNKLSLMPNEESLYASKDFSIS